MNKKGKIYSVLTALVVVLIIILEYNKPQDLNWFPSYAKHHKIPYGSYVLHEQLDRIFTKENIIDVDRPPFEVLSNNEEINGTYFFLNGEVQFDKTELDRLLEWTAKGNTLAIASASISEKLLDTLNLETSVISNFNNFDNIFNLKLQNSQFSEEKYSFKKANFLKYFSTIDSTDTKVIATIANASKSDSIVEKQQINVIKQSFGEGEIILNLFPQAYTNYFILEGSNKNYTAGLLAYLNPDQPIYYDNYYKSGKKIATSPLYVFLKTKELRWAYYIMLIGALFYIIFDGKRKQRAIPIVEPLKNKTLEFTRTIANMYYESGKHDAIAQHKIQHFLEYIRTHLHLNTNTIDGTFIRNLASRSNNTIEDTKTLFTIIETLTNNNKITKEALEKLNASIETYKSNNTWKTKI